MIHSPNEKSENTPLDLIQILVLKRKEIIILFSMIFFKVKTSRYIKKITL